MTKLNITNTKNMSPIETNKRTECIVYSRVVGWLTPTVNYNKGKFAEYCDRKTYKVSSDKVSNFKN